MNKACCVALPYASLSGSVAHSGKSISQLSFSDASNIEDCYLYRLAHQTNLAEFKFVLLVTSTQAG